MQFLTMKKGFICLLLSTAFLSAETLVIESEIASCCGKDIFLKGNAIVEHSLGRISAQSIDLLQEQKSLTLRMCEQVLITLRGGGQLACGKAKIHCDQWFGIFKATESQPEVVYTEMTATDTCLKVKSRQMLVKLARESEEWQFEKIQAQKHVSVNYNQTFTAFGETLTYNRPLQMKSKKIQGKLTLEGAPNQECRLFTEEGDIVEAQQMSIDMQKKYSLFSKPHGELKTLAKGTVVFSADWMHWDNIQHILILEGDVKIHQKGIGHLTTGSKVMLYRAFFDGKWQVRTIRIPGKCVLVHEEMRENAPPHTLVCYGDLEIDRLAFKTFLRSPTDDKGHVLRENQIHYNDSIGEIFADTITVAYTQKQAEVVPSLIVFEGNVYLSNQYSDGNAENALKEYVLADKVEYHPQTKEMYLSSQHGRRVLFYDKIDNLQVSAPSLKIKRDKCRKRDSIQGYGDVRFSFIEHEFDKLKSRFLLDKK